jgi:hypothetical protein
MKDNLLLEVVSSKNTQAIKKAIYETFKDYDKTKDPYYLYLVSLDNIDINTLTVPLCRAYIKFLIDQDDREFKNTSIENGTIHKILRRMKAIYDINYLFSNKSNSNNYFEVMNFHGWYDRDYADKLKYRTKEKPINADIELMHIDEADFTYLCSLLTMLLRENTAYDDPWNKKRLPSGAVDKILTKMISLILIGSYFDEEDELLDI